MEIIYLIGLAIFLCVITAVTFKLFNTNALYVIAIGCAVASNVYNISELSIYLWGLQFGIDSIAYTYFVFCVFLMQFYYGKKDAVVLTFCTVGSICLTGLFAFVSDWIATGIDSNMVWGFVSYIVSAVATYIAMNISGMVLEKLKNKINVVINLLIFILIASLINSFIYFGLMSIITLSITTNLLPMLLGSYIGKVMAIIFCLCSYGLYLLFAKTSRVEEMEKLNFDDLKDCLHICDEDEAFVLDEVNGKDCNDEKNEVENARKHFLNVLPEGYTKKEIEELNDDEIMQLKEVYANHCFTNK